MSENKVKLSKKQKEVIKLMREGWEMAIAGRFLTPSGMGNSIWLQQGGAGKGGKYVKITSRTFDILYKNELIIQKECTTTRTTYALSELGLKKSYPTLAMNTIEQQAKEYSKVYAGSKPLVAAARIAYKAGHASRDSEVKELVEVLRDADKIIEQYWDSADHRILATLQDYIQSILKKHPQ